MQEFPHPLPPGEEVTQRESSGSGLSFAERVIAGGVVNGGCSEGGLGGVQWGRSLG